MRTTRSLASLSTLLFTAVIVASMTLVSSPVHAQSLSVPVDLNWIDGASSCYGTANGQTQNYYGAVAGDTVSLATTNNSNYNLDVSITQGGRTIFSTTLTPGSTTNPSLAVNAETTLLADGSACTSGHGGPGSFIIEAATGSVSCTIQNNQVWTVGSNYSGIFGTATLYRDGTYVQQFTGIKNSSLNESTQFSAMTTTATYSLYYGSSSSARLLGQAVCPAKTVPPTVAPTTTPAKQTNQSTTTPTSTTNSPANQPTTIAKTTPAKPTTRSQIITKNASSKHGFTWGWLLLLVLLIPLTFGGWKLYPRFRKIMK